MDARALLDDGPAHSRGAMYLAGYAIECKIKAKAMELHGCATLSELRAQLRLSSENVYSHALESLVTDLLPKGTKNRLFGGWARVPFITQVNTWSPTGDMIQAFRVCRRPGNFLKRSMLCGIG